MWCGVTPLVGQPPLGLAPVGRRRHLTVGADHFSADPIRHLIAQQARNDGTSLTELSATTRIPLRTLRRVVTADRLHWTVADRCAVALGYHPSQLWPDWFPQ